MTTPPGPLTGIVVVDFTQMMAGPFATQILADLGASVIKVEKPVTGEWERSLASMGEYFHGQSPFFLSMNRGKRSVCIDLKADSGQALVRKLVEGADVVMSNFRPGTLDRLGLSYEEVRKINPGVVYASSSGYGRSGPWVGRPGQDLLLQAVSGMLAQNGRADSSPTPVANSVIDAMTALYNVIGVLAALLGRNNSVDVGEVGVSMLETAIAVQCQELAAHMNLGQDFHRSESGLGAPWNDAPYGVYDTTDGYVAIAMADLALLATILDSDELNTIASSGPTFPHRDQVREILQAITRGYGRDELVDLLLEHDVWCAPVLSFDEVKNLEQVKVANIFRTMDHPTYGSFVSAGLPVQFSSYQPAYTVAPPLPGEHTVDVLIEMGLTPSDIEQLSRDGVISVGTKEAGLDND